MIHDSESDVEGNEKSECNDPESDSYSSDDGNHSEESEGSSVESIDGTLAEGHENKPPQGTGRSHVTGRVQGTHGGSGMSTKGRRSCKEVKPDYKWQEVGAGAWI